MPLWIAVAVLCCSHPAELCPSPDQELCSISVPFFNCHVQRRHTVGSLRCTPSYQSLRRLHGVELLCEGRHDIQLFGAAAGDKALPWRNDRSVEEK